MSLKQFLIGEKDPNALSHIYLHAVLPLLQEIIKHDEQAQELVKEWDCSVMFHVGGGPAVTLKFYEGSCEVIPTTIRRPTIALWFRTVGKLNSFFEGVTVIPMVWKGIWHPLILKNFVALMKRLDYYMKNQREVAKDPAKLPLLTSLLIYTAVYGVKAVAERDRYAKENIIPAMPDGVVQLAVQEGGPKVYLIKNGEDIQVGKGAPPQSPDAMMEVRNINLAFQLFTGNMDALAAVGSGDIRICGLIPLVDGLNALLERLAKYVEV